MLVERFIGCKSCWSSLLNEELILEKVAGLTNVGLFLMLDIQLSHLNASNLQFDSFGMD